MADEITNWTDYVENDLSKTTEILDEASQFVNVAPTPVGSYPLRSKVKYKLERLGFHFENMDQLDGEWSYLISRAYIDQLAAWINMDDKAPPSDMTVDNKALFPSGGYFVGTLFFSRSIRVSESVWNFLIDSFGGGRTLRYKNAKKGTITVFKVFCSNTGPLRHRTFVFSTKTPIFLVKKEICQAWGLSSSHVRWYDFFRGTPYKRIDDDYKKILEEKQLLFGNLTYLDTMNSEGVLGIDFRSVRTFPKIGPSRRRELITGGKSMFPESDHKRNNLMNIKLASGDTYKCHSFVLNSSEAAYTNEIMIAINKEEEIELAVKQKLIEILKQVATIEVRHRMSKFILVGVKDTCEEFRVSGSILIKETFCCLCRFSRLKVITLSSIVDKFNFLERRVLKALESCNTLEMYRSLHFLDETHIGKVSERDFFKFSLTPRITDRIPFPFNTASFYSVKFAVTSLLLLNPQERFTRQLYSVLQLLDMKEVIFPGEKKFHIHPANTMARLSFYN